MSTYRRAARRSDTSARASREINAIVIGRCAPDDQRSVTKGCKYHVTRENRAPYFVGKMYGR